MTRSAATNTRQPMLIFPTS